ncbi:uncharacterized protein LOC117343293 [Pecten maximus]|uniref:uncharacterized protein LOC117343293 n=1 Tax=Pecten maximus TaxID=6579 RepID=UPI0014587826|nr:uncharacterized protein LOC117343293 [Pecten maximus]
MDPADKSKTAFVIRKSLFQFNVLPFGLCNAPATFERLTETVLSKLQWEVCLIYLDDIIVHGRTFDECLKNLDSVFGRAVSGSGSEAETPKVPCPGKGICGAILKGNIRPRPSTLPRLKKRRSTSSTSAVTSATTTVTPAKAAKATPATTVTANNAAAVSVVQGNVEEAAELSIGADPDISMRAFIVNACVVSPLRHPTPVKWAAEPKKVVEEAKDEESRGKERHVDATDVSVQCDIMRVKRHRREESTIGTTTGPDGETTVTRSCHIIEWEECE